MQLGVIGLGTMGGNIVRRLTRAGHHCVVYDVNEKARASLAEIGATDTGGLKDLVGALTDKPRAIWVMLPAGKITEDTVEELGKLLGPGDIIIDGGNSYYKDDVRRAKELSEKQIAYVDCGTSGGIAGLERGYCLMYGGPDEAVKHLDPIFAALAPGAGSVDRTPGRDGDHSPAEKGYVHTGPSGSGHFVKMVHNAIEYGMMQAFAEGFDVMKGRAAKELPDGERFDLDLAQISEVWRRGSVVSSWLLDLTAAALAKDHKLDGFSGFVQDSGEGRWTIEAAIEEAVPVNVLAASLFTRFRSRQEHTFGEKVLSAMRLGFGGHKEKPVGVATPEAKDVEK